METSHSQTLAASTIDPRIATALLALSMFFTGASGFIFECVLSTVATYILGNSIEQFSVTISLMLLMMGVAGYWQQRLSDRRLVEKFLAVEVLLAMLGGFAPTAAYASYATMENHFSLVQYFFVLAIGFLIGLEIPLVLRINRHYVPTLKSNIATVFSTDYIGSFIGALVWVYFFLKYFPLTEISFFVAGVNFLVAVVTYLYFMRHRTVARPLVSLLMILLTAVALGYGYAQNRAWNLLLEQRFYDHPIVYSKTTKYQHIVMTASLNPVDYRLYINGNLQFSSRDEHIYHEQLVHPAMSLAARRNRILILGGGDGLALREVLKHPDVEEVRLIDIDSDMITLAREDDLLSELNHGSLADARVVAAGASGVASETSTRPIYDYTETLPDSGKPVLEEAARVSVYTVDADKMVQRLSGSWDVIVVDFPDPNSVELAKLYSREFYLKLRRILSNGGIMAVQSTSPYHSKESFLCVRRTLDSAGYETVPYHDNVPSFGDWGWILAWHSPKAVRDVRNEIARLDHFGIPEDRLQYLTPEAFRSALTFGKGMLDSHSTEVNRLMHPVLLRFYLSESWQP